MQPNTDTHNQWRINITSTEIQAQYGSRENSIIRVPYNPHTCEHKVIGRCLKVIDKAENIVHMRYGQKSN